MSGDNGTNAVAAPGVSIFVTAQDGRKLHVREHGARSAPGVPVVCLPGLARTTEDFDELAPALAHHSGRPRRVVALDSRGRGRSDFDDPANYNLTVELNDLLAVLTARAIGPAVFVGSSRGGILTMLLASARPNAIAGAVLHDIGPVVEPKGLMRIKSYVGKLPRPRSYEEGAQILRRLFDAQFPKFTLDQWVAAAHRTWWMQNGRLAPSYDEKLDRTLAGIDLERALPPLWNEFDSLARVPMMVIRGANSDILSPATVAAMQARRDEMVTLEVADQGHVPLLGGDEVLGRVAEFVSACDKPERAEAP